MARCLRLTCSTWRHGSLPRHAAIRFENARNLALLSIATNDALIASFKTKNHYKFWRPYTAIRDGGSNASLETLRRIYGAAGHNIALTAVVTTISPSATTLHYTQLQQISDDVDDARVYAGIHFRFDQLAGVRLGKDVATYVYKNNLQPVHP
jgi:hypothetical protein